MESVFCSDIVEKICPLKKFRRNYHDDFKDGIYCSRFYIANSHDRAEWKCHTARWISGKIRKLKLDNIYWNTLFQSFESLNWASTWIKEELHEIKMGERNCDNTNAIQVKTCYELIKTFKVEVEVGTFPCENWFFN